MPDLQGKPSHPADDCPLCKARLAKFNEWLLEWQEKKLKAEKKGKSIPSFRPPCQSCEKPIPEYLNVPAGYEAQTIDHWHLTSVGGFHSFKMSRRAVCLDCYREDWAKVYPDVP